MGGDPSSPTTSSSTSTEILPAEFPAVYQRSRRLTRLAPAALRLSRRIPPHLRRRLSLRSRRVDDQDDSNLPLQQRQLP
ncbi:unnamed protein product [Linum trigynum]|uniref:Uncharacterized protein n=1 Tax=Linum trigynum TaxID=586398 RepID=A0AAV2DK29_9ROSI